MSYVLGIDLGTTFTAVAAVRADGSTRIVDLGNHSAAIPSLVFLRDDATVIVGDAALRRGIAEPHRLAREFKRRVGDDVPIMLARTPYSAERLMGHLLSQVVASIAEREGGAATAVAISHPANWGPFKVDLLRHAVNAAGLPDATFVTEPVAAAIQYASNERVEPGSVVAVYDLGGGTFDAAVLRKTAGGFETLGEPQGIERLGGIDFDEAVFRHVLDAIGGIDHLDLGDASVRSALAHLRSECVAAKEALSADADASVSVLLPGVNTQIRITRTEFEDMVRPALRETVEAVRRALGSARVTPSEVDVVLLAGGSSRIPLISEMVRSELGRPVAVDSHPKLAVALGAARLAAGDWLDNPKVVPSPTPDPVPIAAPVMPADVPTAVTTPAALAIPAAVTTPAPAAAFAIPAAVTNPAAPAAPAAPAPAAAFQAAPASPAAPTTVPPTRTRPSIASPASPPPRAPNRRLALIAGAAVAVVIAVGSAAIAFGSAGDDSSNAVDTTVDATAPLSATTVPVPTTTPDGATTTVPMTAVESTTVQATGPIPTGPIPTVPIASVPRSTVPTTRPTTTTTIPRVCKSESGRCVEMTLLTHSEAQLVVGFRTINFDPHQDQRVRLILQDEHGEFSMLDSNPGDNRFTIELYSIDPQYVRACLSVLVRHNEVELHTEVCRDIPRRAVTSTTTPDATTTSTAATATTVDESIGSADTTVVDE